MQFRIPVAVTQRASRAVLVTSKNSPKMLFVAGVGGMIATTVLASKATLKLEDVLIDAQKDLATADEIVRLGRSDYSERDAQKDRAVIYVRSATKVVKLYAPAIVVGSLSIMALTKSHNIMSRRNAALTAAYAGIDKAFKDYRKRVVDELGPEQDRKFRHGTEQITIIEETPNGPKKHKKTVLKGGEDLYVRRFDARNDAWQPWSEANRAFLKNQQNRANDLLHAHGHITLNEVLKMLEFPQTNEGLLAGWVRDDPENVDGCVDFGCFVNGDDWAPGVLGDYGDGLGNGIVLEFNVQGSIADRI